MIIDLLLDRRDDENCDNFNYNARKFYFNVLQYGEIGDDITKAMDYGTEEEVKKSLCNYIDNNFYNPLIKNYILARQWLNNTSEKKPLVPIL